MVLGKLKIRFWEKSRFWEAILGNLCFGGGRKSQQNTGGVRLCEKETLKGDVKSNR